jgi:phosphoglucomutase
MEVCQGSNTFGNIFIDEVESSFKVTGPYAEQIFGEELGASRESFLKTNILVNEKISMGFRTFKDIIL